MSLSIAVGGHAAAVLVVTLFSVWCMLNSSVGSYSMGPGALTVCVTYSVSIVSVVCCTTRLFLLVLLGGDLTKGDGTGGECSPGGMYQFMHIYSNSTLLRIWPMKHVLC